MCIHKLFVLSMVTSSYAVRTFIVYFIFKNFCSARFICFRFHLADCVSAFIIPLFSYLIELWTFLGKYFTQPR
jgi:hypothetical protein